MANQDQVKFQKELNELVKAGKLSVLEYTKIQTDLKNMTTEQITATQRLVSELAKANREEQKRLALAEKRAKVEQAIADIQDSQVDLATDLQSGLQGNVKKLQGIGKKSKDITTQFISQINAAMNLNSVGEDRSKNLKNQAATSTKLSKQLTDMSGMTIGTGSDETLSAAADQMAGIAGIPIAETFEDALEAAVAMGIVTKDQAQDIYDQNKELQEMAAAMETIANSPIAPVFDAAVESADNLAKSIESTFSKIPGGNFLFKAMGGPDLQKQLSQATVSAFTAMGAAMQGGVGLLGALRAGMAAFNATVMLNPMLLVVAAIAAAVTAMIGLVALASAHEESARDLAKETGLNIAQTKKMVIESQNVANQLDNQLVASEDILDVQSAMIRNMGNVGMMSAEAAAETAEIGIAFGYGAEQAGLVNSTLMSMGVSTSELADTQREFAADITKAGANVDQVFEDITSNTAVVAKYFSGNVHELKKAAIEANKLGMSIADMAGVAEQLLDFENSLAAQFEFQALTGKNINFDLARQLALQGDIAGATQEVLNQVGSIHDFNQMDFMAKQKLAEATGMSVEQLGKSLALQEKLPGMTDAQAAAAERLGLSQAEIMDMSAAELQTRLEQEQAAMKMEKEMQKMKQQLGQALLPLAEALMEVFSALSPVLKLVGIALKVLMMPINLIAGIVGGIVDSFEYLGNLISGNTEGMSAMQMVIGAIAGIAATILGIETAITIQKGLQATAEAAGMSGAAAGLGILIGKAFAGLASAIGPIFSAFTFLGPFGIPLAIAAIAGMTALIMKQVGKAKSTGDLGIDPNGGPVVASPKVGGLYQGDKRDGLSMGPGFGVEGGGASGGATNVSVDMTPVVNAITSMQSILEQIRDKPTTVQLDGARVNRQLRSEDSFRKKA